MVDNGKVPQIILTPFCEDHLSRLVHETGHKESDPWRALAICAQIAMFQAATVTPSVQKRIDGNIERLPEIGCLACRLPQRFDEVIRAGKSHDPGDIKRLGEKWVF